MTEEGRTNPWWQRDKVGMFTLALLTALALAWSGETPAAGQRDVLPAPLFHHLHLNSTDPDKAIEFYTKQFPSTSRTSWAGLPALKSPNSVLVVFTTVRTPPPTAPQTAIWHFGWHVTDVRARMEEFKRRKDVKLLPLHTTDEFADHIALSVTNLDLWLAKLRSEGVISAEQPQTLGDTRTVMIEGPSRELIELVEISASLAR